MQEKIICENDWQYFYLIPLKKFSKIQWKSKNFKIVTITTIQSTKISKSF